MTRLARCAVLALGLIIGVSGIADAQVVFDESTALDDALTRAAETGALVLVDVYATWCGPCHRLDAEVFPTDVVSAAAEGMVTLKVDAERGQGPDVVARFNVVGYPSVLLLRPDGTEIDRIFGFMAADDFAATLAGYAAGTGTIDELRAAVEADPTNLELVVELAERTVVRGDRPTGRALFEQVIAGDPDNDLGLRSRAHHYLGKYGYLRGAADYDAAIEQFSIVREQFPASDEVLSCIFQTGIAQLRADRLADALETFEAAVATAPDESGLYNSVAFTLFLEEAPPAHGIAFGERGLAVDPNDAALLDTVAELYAAAGEFDAAIERMDRAIAVEPDSAYYAQQRVRFEAMRPATAQ